jgi:hypothetical protein
MTLRRCLCFQVVTLRIRKLRSLPEKYTVGFQSCNQNVSLLGLRTWISAKPAQHLPLAHTSNQVLESTLKDADHTDTDTPIPNNIDIGQLFLQVLRD